jgi:molecular chaperone HtpG
LIDAIDKYAVTQLKGFDGKKLVCVSEDGLELEKNEVEKTVREGEGNLSMISAK